MNMKSKTVEQDRRLKLHTKFKVATVPIPQENGKQIFTIDPMGRKNGLSESAGSRMSDEPEIKYSGIETVK